MIARQLVDMLRRQGGEEDLARLLDGVSPACRARFAHGVGFFEWVESELALELHDAWVGLHEGEVMALRGEDAARNMLHGPQGWLLRAASPGFLVGNLPRLFPLYYRGGHVKVALLEPTRAAVELWASGFPESWYQEGLTAWLVAALELTGARGVEVICHTEAPHLHVFQMSWQP